jgi:D-beta-D-heptose 7-phosphate kinase/D-beta-D-heptose 1-phosphate adenosyltransferase
LVTIFDSLDPLNVIDLIRPDVLVKGGDYRLEEVIGRDLVEAYGGMVVIAPLVEGVSTTRILQSAVA